MKKRKYKVRPINAYCCRFTVSITGGRDRLVTKDQRRAIGGMGFIPSETHLLHGGAKGIDISVAKRAREKGWLVSCVPANWSYYIKNGGPIRNSILVRAGDILVTFGGNSGTNNCVSQAIAYETPVVDLSGLGPRVGEDISVPLSGGRRRTPWSQDPRNKNNVNVVLPADALRPERISQIGHSPSHRIRSASRNY